MITHDWEVTYTDGDETEVMTVFNATNIHEATWEALYSLNAMLPFEGTIVKVEKLNPQGESQI